MLSIFLTEELENPAPVAARRTYVQAIYYFCTSAKGRNSATAVLRSLLWQMTEKRMELTEPLLQSFDTPEKSQSTTSNPEILWGLLLKVLRAGADLGTTVCVVDGLDECDEESQRWISEKFTNIDLLESKLYNAFKLAIVSRDLSLLRKVQDQIKLDPDNDIEDSGDVQKLVTTRVEELSTIIGFSQEFRENVQDQLLKRAEGTFLWVGFAMVELRTKSSLTEIEETLQLLPPGLDGIYG